MAVLKNNKNLKKLSIKDYLLLMDQVVDIIVDELQLKDLGISSYYTDLNHYEMLGRRETVKKLSIHGTLLGPKNVYFLIGHCSTV